MFAYAFLRAAFSAALVLAASSAVAMEPARVALLRGLDKVAAQSETWRVAVGDVARLGPLDIIVRACFASSPVDPPDAAAFLEIFSAGADADPQPLFAGWMFAASPAIHSLEAPAYDVWLIGCE